MALDSIFAKKITRIQRSVQLTLCILIAFCTRLDAEDFLVEFDIGPVGGVNGNVVRSHLNKSDWTTVGHRLGSNLSNNTGDTIVAIWMKVPEGDHTFLATATGGKAFATVWRKKDGSELLFLDGSVPRGSIFWNRVRPRYLNNTNPLEGQAYHNGADIPKPDENEWDRLTEPVFASQPKDQYVWKRLAERTAKNLPAIRNYTPVSDTSVVAFISEQGFPYVYDARTDQLIPIIIGSMWPLEVDHLDVSMANDGKLIAKLLLNGTIVAEGHCDLQAIEPPPTAEAPDTISRVYFSGPNVFDLETGGFKFTFLDFPSAHVFRVKGSFKSADKQWYYFESPGVDSSEKIQWRFTIEPSKAFDGHRIQRQDNSGWRDLADRVYMTIPAKSSK
jgi:hypothetical protein